MNGRKLVTAEVAGVLGVQRRTLTVYLCRHPELRPADRLPGGDYLWSEEDIAALVERRSRKVVRRKIAE